MQLAALVPVKRFAAAKGRLAPTIGDDLRDRLARWMASGVVRALGGIDVFVACDDATVRSWALERGAHVVWGPGLGLNGAIDDGVHRIADLGYDHVTISHADLPRPGALGTVARPGTITLVPDRRLDGTNVLSFPLTRPIAASYGGGSFRRHLELAQATGVTVEVRHDQDLSLDIDTPHDLSHPLIDEVLPPWLRTNPASRP